MPTWTFFFNSARVICRASSASTTRQRTHRLGSHARLVCQGSVVALKPGDLLDREAGLGCHPPPRELREAVEVKGLLMLGKEEGRGQPGLSAWLEHAVKLAQHGKRVGHVLQH